MADIGYILLGANGAVDERGVIAGESLAADFTDAVPPAHWLDEYAAVRLPALLPAEGQVRSPRRLAIASLRAARELMRKMVEDASIDREAARALAAVDLGLRNIEGELSDLEQGKPPGPITSRPGRTRPEKERTLEHQARTVIAVRWLQMLTQEPLRPGEAMKLVARILCGSESEIDTWLVYFQRPNTPRRHELIYRMWHELEDSRRRAGTRLEHASQEQVLQWLQQE